MKKAAQKVRDTDAPEAFHVSMALIDESIRRDFGKHLGELLARHDPPWGPSDLARKVFGTIDGTATGFAKGRDLVSKYLRGITFPNNKTLDAIAKALGVAKADVLPPAYRAVLRKGQRQNYIKETDDGFFEVRIEGKVPHDVALDIMSRYLAGERTYKAHVEAQQSKRGKT